MATWAKSSQYRGMPHQQYMQTEEGQRSNQFFREDARRMREGRNTPQRTGFATVRAQSQQSPYTSSTPYQKNPSGDFAAYSPQQNTQQFGNTTLNQSYSPGTSPYGQAPQMPTSPTDGNWANYATQNRPAPFTARYGQPDGSFSDSPSYNQRDAFIQALNNQQTPYMTGQARGMPQYDIGSAFNQASQMVQQGFQNPFAPNLAAQPQQPPLPNLAAQAFPSQLRARDAMYAERGRNAGQTPLRFQPGASQMVGGMVQSTGATGYGFGSGQGGPNPGAVGYYNRTGNQQPKTIGRKRGMGTSNRSPIYI